MNARQAMILARRTSQPVRFRDNMIMHPSMGLVERFEIVKPENATSVDQWISKESGTWKELEATAKDARSE